MPNQVITTTNKQTDRGWVCAESLLKIQGLSASKVVHIPHSPSLDFSPYEDWSISMVLTRPTSVPSNQVFLGKKDYGIDAPGIAFYFATTFVNTIGVEWCNGTPSKMFDFFDLNCPLGSSFHLVVTYVASTKLMSMYSNGILMGAKTLASPTGSYNNTNPMKVGTYQDDTGYDGNVAFLSKYNKTLTAFEVEQLYNDISIIPKSLHPYCVGFWPMQERTGDKAYDTVELFNRDKGGSPLTPNHGDLIGYTATELGTATNETTQTAKVDFYTKSVTDRTNGSGIELSTGLPTLTGALQIIAGFNAPTTAFASNLTDTDNWGIMLGLNTISGATPVWHFLCYGRDSGVTRWYIQVQHGATAIYMTDTSQYMTIATPTDRPFKLFIQRVGFKKVQLRVDGLVYQVGTNGNLNLPGDTIDYTSNVDPKWKDFSGNIINQISWTASNWHMTQLAFRKGNWTVEEMLKISNNMNQANPISLDNYIAYYNPSSLTSYQIVDQTGINGNISLSTYTVNQMTPGHPDYKIKDYNTLR